MCHDFRLVEQVPYLEDAVGEAEVSGDFKVGVVHCVPAGIVALFPLFPELFPVLHGMALRVGQKKVQGDDYGKNEYVFMHCAGFYFVSLSSLVEGRAKVRKFPGPRFAWGDVFFRFVCILLNLGAEDDGAAAARFPRWVRKILSGKIAGLVIGNFLRV